MLLLAKLGLYGGLFYIFITNSLVHPIGVFLGITGTSTLYTISIYLRLSAPTEEVR